MLDTELLCNTVFVIWSHLYSCHFICMFEQRNTLSCQSTLTWYVKYFIFCVWEESHRFVDEKMQRMCFKVPTCTDSTLKCWLWPQFFKDSGGLKPQCSPLCGDLRTGAMSWWFRFESLLGLMSFPVTFSSFSEANYASSTRVTPPGDVPPHWSDCSALL